jgi:hypothetical protein
MIYREDSKLLAFSMAHLFTRVAGRFAELEVSFANDTGGRLRHDLVSNFNPGDYFRRHTH